MAFQNIELDGKWQPSKTYTFKYVWGDGGSKGEYGSCNIEGNLGWWTVPGWAALGITYPISLFSNKQSNDTGEAEEAIVEELEFHDEEGEQPWGLYAITIPVDLAPGTYYFKECKADPYCEVIT